MFLLKVLDQILSLFYFLNFVSVSWLWMQKKHSLFLYFCFVCLFVFGFFCFTFCVFLWLSHVTFTASRFFSIFDKSYSIFFVHLFGVSNSIVFLSKYSFAIWPCFTRSFFSFLTFHNSSCVFSNLTFVLMQHHILVKWT